MAAAESVVFVSAAAESKASSFVLEVFPGEEVRPAPEVT